MPRTLTLPAFVVPATPRPAAPPVGPLWLHEPKLDGWRESNGRQTVQFDDDTWQAIVTIARRCGISFQQLTDEAFADLLNKHKQPVELMASLKESLGREESRDGLRGGPKSLGALGLGQFLGRT